MFVRNLTPRQARGGGKPYDRTYSYLLETLHQDRLMVARNLTKHIHGGEKPYIGTLMLVKNLTLRLTHADD